MFNVQLQHRLQLLGTTAISAIILAATACHAAPVAAATTNWVHCANEGETCNFSGVKNLRYGAEGRSVYRTTSGPVACTNAVFGDPYTGTYKYCDIADTTAAAPTPTPTPAPAPGSRDALKSPFASNSIWNMPIGSGASYVAANLPAVPGGDV